MDARRALLVLVVVLGAARVDAQNVAASSAVASDNPSAIDGSAVLGTSPGAQGQNYDQLWKEGDLAVGDTPSRTSVIAEGLFLHLNRGNHMALVADRSTQAPLVSTGDLDHDFTGGPRIGLRRTLCNGHEFELSYFGSHEWDTSYTITGSSNLTLPGPLGATTQDFANSNRMTASLNSQIHNVEANLYYPLTHPGLSFLTGFRYFSLNERFDLSAESHVTFPSDYRIDASTNLFGGQLGLKLKREWGSLGFEFYGKAGVFGADSQQRTFLGDDGNADTLRDTYARDGRVSFVGDMGINGTLRVTQSIYCRAGYNLIWVEGVARATDQLDFSTSPDASTALLSDGSAFMHGASVGVEARW